MRLTLLCVVWLMTVAGFAKVESWERFNSSLLIEVTRDNGVFTCTGVALSSRTLVTAAHCLEGKIQKVRIFTQDHYDPKLPSLAISHYKIHPEYNLNNSRYRSDIAKIIMKEDLPSFIRILPIAKGNAVIGDLYRFGFGARYNRNVRTVVTPKFRRLNLQDSVIELDDMFSRSGDSGGPIYLQKGQDIEVLAIHSTFSHGPEGQFSLNPLLNSYLPWIFEN